MKWVFWIQIRRRKWFTNFHATRGANFKDIQFFGLLISFGLPWLKSVIESYNRDYTHKAKEHIQKVNADNLKHKFSILMPACK